MVGPCGIHQSGVLLSPLASVHKSLLMVVSLVGGFRRELAVGFVSCITFGGSIPALAVSVLACGVSLP